VQRLQSLNQFEKEELNENAKENYENIDPYKKKETN